METFAIKELRILSHSGIHCNAVFCSFLPEQNKSCFLCIIHSLICIDSIKATDKISLFLRKALDTLKASVDRIIRIHTQLSDLGMLCPDTDDESDPLSPPPDGKSWPRSRLQSVTSVTRSRSPSVISMVSDATTEDERVCPSICFKVLKRLMFSLKTCFVG